MRFKKFIVNEAKFSKGDLKRVSELLATVVGKKIGSELYPFGGREGYFEKFSKMGGSKGVGYIYLFGEGQLIRFNWESDRDSSTITSIDLWNSMQDEDPYATLIIPDDYNIVQSAGIIVDFIKNPFSSNLGESKVEEARKPGKKKVEAAEKYGVDISLPYAEFWKQVKKKQKGETSNPTTKKAAKETSTRSKEIKNAEKAMSKKEYADPDVVFQDLSDLVDMVSSGIQKSLMVTGMAGVGKTYTVEEQIKSILGAPGDKWISMKGKTSPYGLYSTLYMNRDRLIVFDDMDSVFKDVDTVNMLKAALDSTGENTVTWTSKMTMDLSLLSPEEKDDYLVRLEDDLRAVALGEKEPKNMMKLPSSFDFKGQVIFISNLHKSKIDPAILSRSFAIDITLTAKDVFKRMESILPNIMPDAKSSHKTESLDFLKTLDETSKEVNIRTLLNTIKCRASGNPRWTHLASKYA